ncbi:LLM class flavin-dependent oxidoreductase [Rugosimonospora africana]|uniref:Luciferase-like protein n=1 Tax=Rugosimonospora africana TaxID=556532 RepID=A0A8J3VQP6_9ACTN|nr:LLM class flavin-dependent oxidoreductase [Rugosimonospora africana]GIH15355.1 luciferase-like protein [Rugosimonospora africana]
MDLRYAVGLPVVGEFGDVHTLVELAVAAQRHGWDGVYLWDHVLYHESGWPVASPVVAASAIAAATDRLRVIMAVNLPRRQILDVARDTATIDALSGRRLTVLAVLGSMEREYTDGGLDADPRTRGRALDERLTRLRDLWAEWDVPRVPVWCGGRWPRRAGLRRAARCDGAMPTFEGLWPPGTVPVDRFAAAASFVRDLAPGPLDIAVEGSTAGPAEAALVAPYAAAGLTWWVEALGWWRGDLRAAAARIAAGPPAAGRDPGPRHG